MRARSFDSARLVRAFFLRVARRVAAPSPAGQLPKLTVLLPSPRGIGAAARYP
ncbi:hypothetical protein BURMUCF2_3533 [Burkholderia multivorans CF2]|nr:hypothetical protein BURMUCF2_3533 [Burkholderia multivorans CF2]